MGVTISFTSASTKTSMGRNYYFGWLTLAIEGGWRPQGLKCLLDPDILPTWSDQQRQQEIDNFLGYLTPEEADGLFVDEPDFKPASRAELVLRLLQPLKDWNRKFLCSYCPMPDDEFNTIIITQADCWAMAAAIQNRNRWRLLPPHRIANNLIRAVRLNANAARGTRSSRASGSGVAIVPCYVPTRSGKPTRLRRQREPIVALFCRLEPRHPGEEKWIEFLRQVDPDGLLVHVS